uniref:Peptide ABC transporter n=1 Tax=OCS116 cluster bacterium TaxID=2030921 RepID=A0A2A4YUM0_9PROT
MKVLKGLIAAATLASMMTGTAFAAQNVVNVAIVGEPDTMDPMMSTKDVVSIVTQHFYETLFTFNSKFEVVPLLAETMPTISDDGKSYSISIRQGITFHDGSTMDAHDVADSLNRWVKTASRGKGVADKIDSISASDDFTVMIKMNTAYSPLLSLLAFSNSAAVVYPQENIGEDISAVVGTGPYKLEAHKPDQYIQLVKFDNYVSRDEPSDGGSGARTQSMDEIRFIPVPDSNTRVEGILSGQFDFADGLPVEAIKRLEASDKAEPMVLRPFGWPIFAFNHKDGLNTNLHIRLAVQAALNEDDMLFAAFGDDAFFVTDGPLYPEGWFWRTDAGASAYNVHDADAAAGHLKAAGYDGTPLRILTSHQYEFHFKLAEVAKVNLEAAGFKVKLDVVDWATLGQRRNNPELWDIYITHSPFIAEPALNSMYSPTSRLGWKDAEKEAILAEFTSVSDPEQRKVLFSKLQEKVFEQVPFIKIGGFNALLGKSSKLNGVTKTPWPFFWNATIDD